MNPTVKNIYINFLSRSRRQIEENDFKPRRVDKFYLQLIREWLEEPNVLAIDYKPSAYTYTV
jgi:hypothetical protein